jgi:hypothetical protein
MPRIDIHAVADCLEGTGPSTTVHLDKRTGECVEFNHDFLDPDGVNADIDLEADHWIELPDSFDRDEWRMMEAFAESQAKPRDRERLLRAIHGRGAFRVFKDTAHDLGLLTRWYAYLHDETVRILRGFLTGEGMEIDDRRRPGHASANDVAADA